MFILSVVKKLDEHGIPYAVVGGHAVALHGAVRGTVDIDFITEWRLENLQKIEVAMTELGLKPLQPLHALDLYENRDRYVDEKNLIAWGFVNHDNPMEHIDIIVTEDLTGKVVENFRVGDQKITVLAKNELIKMKRLSGREQDLIDIDALERLDGL